VRICLRNWRGIWGGFYIRACSAIHTHIIFQMHVDSDRFLGGGVGGAQNSNIRQGLRAVHLLAVPYVPRS